MKRIMGKRSVQWSLGTHDLADFTRCTPACWCKPFRILSMIVLLMYIVGETHQSGYV